MEVPHLTRRPFTISPHYTVLRTFVSFLEYLQHDHEAYIEEDVQTQDHIHVRHDTAVEQIHAPEQHHSYMVQCVRMHMGEGWRGEGEETEGRRLRGGGRERGGGGDKRGKIVLKHSFVSNLLDVNSNIVTAMLLWKILNNCLLSQKIHEVNFSCPSESGRLLDSVLTKTSVLIIRVVS